RVILKEVAGVTHEPFEQVVVNCSEEYTGAVIQKLAQRGGELVSLKVDQTKQARMEWTVASRGLIGYRSEFLTDTRGTGTLYHVFSHYGAAQGDRRKRQRGVMIAMDQGQTVAFALFNLQDRAQMFMGPGHDVYGGQIVGLDAR